MNEEIALRIALALERIADAVEKAQVAPVKTSKVEPKQRVAGVQEVIGAYIDAMQKRYGARPDVGGKVQGLVKLMLKDYRWEDLSLMVRAFVQMNDTWFQTKAHDFPTFYENVGKVKIALQNGTATAGERDYWRQVWGNNDAGNLQGAGREIKGHMGGEELPSGENLSLLESLPEFIG